MSAWECPRCGQMNAIWREKCDCPPRTVVTDRTSIPAGGTAMPYRKCEWCGGNYYQCGGSHTVV